MKNERLAKKVQMILIAIFVVVIGIIVVALLLNNRVSAAIATCRACGGTNVSVSSTGDTSHTITCRDSTCDGFDIPVSQVHNLGSTGKCTICGYQCPHSSYSDGKCTRCGAQCTHSYSGGVCTKCGHQCTHTYNRTGWSTTSTTHAGKYKCSTCGVSYTGSASKHTPTHENEGKCTVCEYQCETHSMSEEIVDYEKTETGHTPMYGCTLEGCDGTYTGDEEAAHEGATHENEGKCAVCEYQYESHTMSEEILDYEKTETGHTPIYGCTFEGCEGTHKEEEQPHEGANHENEGKCTVCEYQYQTHSMSEAIVDYEKTETGHTPIYGCTLEGCEGTYTGDAEVAHEGVTHENEGKCAVCEYQCEIHSKSEEIVGYEKTEAGHTPKYGCTLEGCEGTYTGDEETTHEGATHENEGKCTVCEYKYQIHGVAEEQIEYEKTETAHTPIYGCTFEGCEGTHKGEEENHTGATHENEGKCTVCEYQYQIHSMSDEIVDYEKTETGHTPIYGCTLEGCEWVHKVGTEEPHNVEVWTDEENGVHSGECTECGQKVTEEHDYGEDGRCKDCGARILAEECEHKYEIQKNETHHWKYCPKCETTEQGSFEPHKYGEYTKNEDGTHSATCAVCESELTEKHNYEMKNDETYHWENCLKCETIKEGTKEKHIYEKYVDNGDGTHSAICTVCKYQITEKHNYEEDGTCEECEKRVPANECNHNYEMKNDDTYHWKFCSICQTIEEGSKQKHTYEKYIDNGNGTHSATCTVCEYKLTEKHNYEDEKCAECDSIKTSDDGQNDNKDEGKEENNNNNNSNNDKNNNGNNNNNSNKDNTTSDKEIPKAGSQSAIMIVIIALGAVLGVSIFKMKKYKDV